MTGFAIGIAVACLAALIWWGARRRRSSPWARAAHRLGLRWRGAAMEGTLSGLSVRVFATEPAWERHPQAAAFVHCALPLALDLGLSIHPKGHAAGHAHGDAQLSDGTEPFRAGFEAWADDADRAAPLVTPELCDLIIRCADYLDELGVTDDGVHGKLEGWLDAPDRLREAVEAALAVAMQLERARHEVPVARVLAAERRAFAALAGAYEIDLSTTPLAVTGLFEAMRVRCHAERLEAGRYRLVVAVELSEPLELGLSVGPRRGRRGRSRGRRGRRSRRERTRFARLFDTTAEDVWGADRLLHRPIREGLLALRDEFGPVWLTDDELRLHVDAVPHRREQLEHALRSMAAVGRLIEARAHGRRAERGGPYR